MTRAVYPGSFDPVTLGHLDVITRGSRFFDEVIVGVLQNSAKSPLFSVEERVNMLREVTEGIDNIEIQSFDGLLIDFAKSVDAHIIVRGLRAVTDFEYELQLAQTNKAVYPDIDTLFLVTSVVYSYLSSSVVREIASYNGDISKFVPECVTEKLKEKFDK